MSKDFEEELDFVRSVIQGERKGPRVEVPFPYKIIGGLEI